MRFSTHPFTLRQLQYAVAIAEARSFRAAAARCHVSQPALSAQVALLEEALGSRLFERGSKLVITAAGEELLGIEIGFAGPNFYAFKANLAALAPDLIARGEVSYEELVGLTVRAGQASYLNAHIPDDVYYLHALSAFPQHRGKGVGKRLLEAAIARARAAGHRELQLDVLADNPAVGFYQAMGLQILAEIRSPELSRAPGFPSELRMGIVL